MTIRPRALVHRGSIEANGLCFDASWLEDSQRRSRVLACADRSTTVLALDDAILVHFAWPSRVDAERCEATPLVAHGESLLALPLGARERERLDLDRGPPVLVRARAGRIVVQPLVSAQVVDLSTWLDTSDWTVARVESLGAPRVVERAVLVEGAEGAPEVRTILGASIPKPAIERAALLAALAGEKSPHRDDREPGAVGGWLGGVGRWFGDLFASGEAPALPPGTPSVRPRQLPAPPGPLRRWLASMLARSPLVRAIGRKQAEYLGRTLRMFEDGDFEAALRHAIPLSSMPGSAEQTSLSVPTPRDHLRLSTTRGPAAGIHVGEEFLTHMRTLYRNAARELELRGRYEEAAFVLFELLGNDDAGVAMLERHEQYALAAKMAEARGLAPGIAIRLWFLAGEPREAVRVARRTGAYADAIARLERGNGAYAQRLRILWGERLAEAGDFAAAVDAVWSVSEARALARRWLDLAIAFGGPTGARMLARKVTLAAGMREDFGEIERDVEAIANDDSPDGAALRRILGGGWPRTTVDGPARRLGRDLCRRMMLDAHARGDGAAAVVLRDKLGDRLFAFDGAPPKLPATPSKTSIRAHVFEAHERGLQSIDDVVALPSGRHLCALGDAGLVVVDRHGHTVRRYEHPATSIVLADNGTRAVTMIRRGAPEDAPATLGRIDLRSGRAEPWCDAHFVLAADDHDGAVWYLAEHDAVAAVDLQAPGISVLWRVGRLPGRVLAVARSTEQLSFALAHARENLVEVWTYAIDDQRRLDRRESIEIPAGGVVGFAQVAPHGAVVIGVEIEDRTQLVAWHPGGGTVLATAPLPMQVACGATGALVAARSSLGCTITRTSYDTLGARPPLLTLHGATKARMRTQGSRVLVCDDRGRLVVLDDADHIVQWQLVT